MRGAVLLALAPAALRAPSASMAVEPAMLVPGARRNPARSAARTLLDASFRSPNLLAAPRSSLPFALPRAPTGASVLNAAVRWALSSGKSSEDLLLALVAPDTYRLLLRWRRALFGEEGEMRGRLDEARRQLYALSGSFEPLARSSVSVRSKGLWSTFHKVQQRGQSVNDVLALRVVVDGDELDCYRVLAAAHSLWPSVDGRRKDYVAAPKGNGYRALHDTVTLPCGTPMEIQVRTVEMHAHAEIGDAAHRLYKGAAFSMPTAALRGLAAI